MIRGARAAATSDGASAAAQAALDAGGNAIDAAAAGFFTAAGERAGVLFAPAVMLIAGPGEGARVFDGRAVQAGRGGPKARVAEGAPIAARAAAPRSVAMMVLAHTLRGKLGPRDVVRGGVAAADAIGAKARASLLKSIGRAGVLALAADDLIGSLLEAAGPSAGGALTRDDIADAAPEDGTAVELTLGETNRVVLVPEALTRGEGRVASAHAPFAVVAVDVRGVAAALIVDVAHRGVDVPTLEVTLPACGVAARRGIPRLAPGTAVSCGAPIAIALGRSLTLALALPGPLSSAVELDFSLLFSGQSIEEPVAALRRASGAERAFAVVRASRDARIIG